MLQTESAGYLWEISVNELGCVKNGVPEWYFCLDCGYGHGAAPHGSCLLLGKSTILEVAELACRTFFIVKGPTPSRSRSNTDVALVLVCARSSVRQHSPSFAAHTGELSRDSQVPFLPPSFWQGLRFAVQNVRRVAAPILSWSPGLEQDKTSFCCCGVQW
jgi:hypothetical protein